MGYADLLQSLYRSAACWTSTKPNWHGSGWKVLSLRAAAGMLISYCGTGAHTEPVYSVLMNGFRDALGWFSAEELATWAHLDLPDSDADSGNEASHSDGSMPGSYDEWSDVGSDRENRVPDIQGLFDEGVEDDSDVEELPLR